jgi:hypothetical protein
MGFCGVAEFWVNIVKIHSKSAKITGFLTGELRES